MTGFAMAGIGDPRRALLEPAQGREIVAERIGSRVRIEADRGRDPRQDRVACDHDAVALEDDVTVGMAGQYLDPPPIDLVARLEQPVRVLHPVHRSHEPVRLGDDSLDRRARHPMQRPVVGEPLRIPLPPGAHALSVVDPALEHGRPRELGHVARPTHVIRVHVRDDDRLDRSVERVDDRPPAGFGVARAEAGVDEDEAPVRRPDEIAVHMVDAERQREGDAIETLLHLHHA